MRTALLLVLAASLGVTLPSDAKGTLNYKGKSKDFAIALKYAHLSLSEISCVGFSMRSSYAPHAETREAPDRAPGARS